MSQTELYIENTRVDLSDDVVMPLTLWLSTIKDIGKRTSSYSKTIQIPSTKRNNEIFSHAYDLQLTSQTPSGLNIGTSFNRKKLTDFLLTSNGSNILSGTCQLQRVKETDGDIIYEVTLFGELVNLINSISDKELRDLDTTELEHRFDMLTLIQSWSYNQPYVYPLIDHGIDNTRMESVTMSTFRPAVKASWYWDKIFDEAGFTYSGSFFDTDQWTKLILPYNGEEMERVDDVTETNITNNSQIISAKDTEFFIFDLIREDESGYYNTTTETYTVGEAGEYTIRPAFIGNLFLNPQNIGDSSRDGDIIKNYPIHFDIQLYQNGTVIQTQRVTFDDGLYSQVVEAGGFIPSQSFNFTVPTQFSNKVLSQGDEIRVGIQWTLTDPTTFYNEDASENVTRDSISGFSYGLYLEGSELNIDTSGVEGGILTGDIFVPADFKQKDFITGILKLFNLYVETDPNEPRKVNVKTRDNYYDTNVFRDWTQKIDHSQEITNETIEDSNVRTLQLKWKEDEDDYQQQLYKRTWGRDYGEKRIDTGYEYNNEIKDVLELPFSTVIPIQYRKNVLGGDTRIEVLEDDPTLVRVAGLSDVLQDDGSETEPDLPQLERTLVGRKIAIGEQELTITEWVSPWEFRVNTNVTNFGNQTINGIQYRVFNRSFTYVGEPDKVVPAIFKSEDGGETTEPYDSEVRLMYYNGTIGCNSWTIQQTPQKYETSVRFIYNESFDVSNSYTVYPFVSHVLGTTPKNFDFDLLFERPDQIYWNL